MQAWEKWDSAPRDTASPPMLVWANYFGFFYTYSLTAGKADACRSFQGLLVNSLTAAPGTGSFLRRWSCECHWEAGEVLHREKTWVHSWEIPTAGTGGNGCTPSVLSAGTAGVGIPPPTHVPSLELGQVIVIQPKQNSPCFPEKSSFYMCLQ